MKKSDRPFEYKPADIRGIPMPLDNIQKPAQHTPTPLTWNDIESHLDLKFSERVELHRKFEKLVNAHDALVEACQLVDNYLDKQLSAGAQFVNLSFPIGSGQPSRLYVSNKLKQALKLAGVK